MALPTSGQISFSAVNVELEKSATASISLGDSDVRSLFLKLSGAIAISDGYNKAKPYPATILTYNGADNADTTAVALEGGTSFNVSISGSTALDGRKIQQLHIVSWGAGGAGSTWPSGAAGGYGGAGYRISLIRSTSSTIASLLDSITSMSGQAGNAGTPWWSGYFTDNRQAGGAGGTSYLNINSTRLITTKGGDGSRQVWTNPDSNFVYSTNSGSVGDSGGSGASEYGDNAGSATYGGGGGSSNNSTVYGTSTYAGRGGSRNNGGSPGTAPAGGGGGYNYNSSRIPRGAVGRVVIYINTTPPF